MTGADSKCRKHRFNGHQFICNLYEFYFNAWNFITMFYNRGFNQFFLMARATLQITGRSGYFWNYSPVFAFIIFLCDGGWGSSGSFAR